MEQQDTYTPVVDHACPVGLILVPMIVGGLLWLVTFLSRLPT